MSGVIGVKHGGNLDGATDDHWQMAVDNHGLVWRHVNRLQPPEHVRDDMYQDGLLGLVRAAMKFDPAKGYTFATYADAWIINAIQRGRGARDGRSWRSAERKGVLLDDPLSLDAPLPGMRVGLDGMIAADSDPEGEAVFRDLADRVYRCCDDELDVAVAETMICDRGVTSGVLANLHEVNRQTVWNRRAKLRERARAIAA